MRPILVVVLLLAACTSSSDGGGVAGTELFGRLAGLWSGPATDTQLGDFPLKNIDLRAAGDSVLFGRVDLDLENSLRFAFAVEIHDGAPVLVFRNGGLFQGLSRDTRTRLVESDGTSYRFCALEGGCEYVDATFRFDSETSLELRVMVRGALHETWTPTRVETRPLPTPFPARTDLAGDADFPPLPSARIRVAWTAPAAASTDVWLILSTTSCVPSGACQFSRWMKAQVAAGATDVMFPLDQIHGGAYSILGVVDGNNNLESTRYPDAGDLLSVPSPTLTIAAEGTTTAEAFAGFSFE
jgi:hypothetical protein